MKNIQITEAAELLKKGELVAIPTETVYGLAANAFDEKAVKRIFSVKQRPTTSPLILHSYSLETINTFVKKMPPVAYALAKAFWPGPLTLVVSKKKRVPSILSAGLPTIGVRIPSHPVVRALLAKLPFPLAAPSANPFGYISPTRAQHVREQLEGKVAYIIDAGATEQGLESTIVGFQEEQPILYRRGALPQEEIEKITGPITYLAPTNKKESAQIAPGRTAQHYAPRTPMLFGDPQTLQKEHPNKKIGAINFYRPLPGLPLENQIVLSANQSLQEAAQKFFAALHQMDKKKIDLIIAPIFPDNHLGKTLNERVRRAVHSK